VITAMLVAGATAGTAGATSLAQKKSEARAAQVQLSQLQNAAERKVEKYDLAHQKYQNTLAALRNNQRTLTLARQNLHAAQQQLADSLLTDYKSGNQDAIAYLLAARSIGDLVDQVQVLQRTTGVNKTLLADITRFQGVVVRREALLKKQRAQKAHYLSVARAERNAAQASVRRADASERSSTSMATRPASSPTITTLARVILAAQ